jgi:hypothetical protein
MMCTTILSTDSEKHYGYRTEQQYVAWIRRFILHHGRRHPQEMSGREVEQFLTHLP